MRNIFEVDDTGKMVEYGYPSSVSEVRVEEIMSSFLKAQNLDPVWTNCNGNFGYQNESTGLWTGVVSEVRFSSVSLKKYFDMFRLLLTELILECPITLSYQI